MRLTNLLLLSALVALPTGALQADEYSEVVEQFRNAPESRGFFRHSYGYAVFPVIGRAGIGLGGAHGRGRVYRGGTHVGNTRVSQVTLGLQLGAQSYSQIIFFEDERAFREFTGGNYEFGAQAQAIAITASASASANTAGGATGGATTGPGEVATAGAYHRGMAVFTVARGGLMYEASIGGQKFSYSPL
jgi:lipid-binding SYLF domain-containing protein